MARQHNLRGVSRSAATMKNQVIDWSANSDGMDGMGEPEQWADSRDCRVFRLDLAVPFVAGLVALGHWLGLKMHHKWVSGDKRHFYRVIGSGLCTVSILGLWSLL